MSNFWKKLAKPITVLAPMDDVTDVVFREIVVSLAKPDVLFTEFTSTDGLFTKGHDRVAQRLRFTPKQKPVVAQIWGAKPENYEKAAKYIAELGFDGIDINMGCPQHDVMKRKCGAALINTPRLAEEIIKATKQGAPKLPLSVKTRLAENPMATEEWLAFLFSQNIDVLTLHGRDAKSMSKVDANWEEIGKAVNLRNNLNKPTLVIGNGDVKSYSEIIDKHKIYGVDGVMVGRGIFNNPWIFEKNVPAIEHGKMEYLKLLIDHTRLFNDTWAKDKNFEIMKKFFKVYVKGFKGADEIRQQLMLTKNLQQVETIIEQVDPNLVIHKN